MTTRARRTKAITNPGPVRAAVYLRISRDDMKQGLGVARQRELCQRLAATLGWEIVAEFDENDTKASDPRPKFDDMLAQIKAGQINAVLGYNQDRVTRDPIEAELLLRLAGSHGLRAAFYVKGTEVNFSDPDERYQFRNATSGAAREIDLDIKRATDEREQRAAMGRAHAGVTYGWTKVIELSADGSKVVGSRLELHPDQAPLIKAAAKRLTAGVSLRAIAADMNAAGPGPRGAAWNSTSVRRMLARPSNAGLRVHQGQVLEGVQVEWPAILDHQTYQRVMTVLADPARQASNRGSAVRWLLSGLLTCARCPGARVRVRLGGREKWTNPVYSCDRCYQTLGVADVDAHVSLLVKGRLADPGAADVADDVQAELDAIYARQDAIRAEQSKAGGLVPAVITLDQLIQMNATWNAEWNALDAQAKALLPATASAIELPNGWDDEQDLNVKRAIIQRVFTTLELQPNPDVVKGHRRRFRPQDIRHVWR